MTALRAWAELGRVSNLPTVLTNVLVGAAIGAGTAVGGAAEDPLREVIGAAPPPIPWLPAAVAALAVALLYTGGMILNDAVDAAVDRAERPGRPIPSGRVGRRTAFLAAAALLAVGIATTIPLGGPALGFALSLAGVIVLYNALHRLHPATVLLMGACRALVYPLAAAAVAWPLDLAPVLWIAGAVGLYTVLLSLVARGEAGGPCHRPWLCTAGAVLAPMVPLAPVLAIHPQRWWFAAGAGLLVLFWLGHCARAAIRSSGIGVPARTRQDRAEGEQDAPATQWRDTQSATEWRGTREPGLRIRAVLGMLAGFCLIDVFYLTLLDRPLLAFVGLAGFAVTLAAHRRILGT